MGKRIAIVIPVLDDWPAFTTLVERLGEAFAGTATSLLVLAVDDGSRSVPMQGSMTLPTGSPITEVSVLRMAVNLGHQRAIAAGLAHLASREGIDAAIVMDGDGEDRPQDAVRLCAAADSHPESVVLARRATRTESALFRAGYVAYKLLFRLLTGRSINFGNFCFLPMGLIRRLIFMPELWNNLPAAVIRSRIRFATLPVNRGIRYAGKSKMNIPSLILHGMSAMSVYTDVIFVRVLMAAISVAAVSVLGMITVSVIRLFTRLAIPGWASAMFADLVIVLMQTLVMIVATSLMVLAGRSQRPIIPALDGASFVMSELRLNPARAEGSAISHAQLQPIAP